MNFDRYVLIGQLGDGRYGTIWKAQDPEQRRAVVLKQLALAGPDQRQRIVAEARSAGRLDHPNIARTYEPAEDGSGIWLVEEWIEGASLARLIPPQVELTLQQSLGVLHGALEGLAHAHRNGVVHGSVAPRTILVDRDGTPKLVEFAAWRGHPDAAAIGMYASPEGLRGDGLTPAADVFSAGTVINEVLQAHAAGDQAQADRTAADIQPVLDRAMAVDPTQRQPDAQHLLDELDKAATRAFGPAWWTTEGLGALAASASGAGLAGAGGAAAGGAGALGGTTGGGYGTVAGSMNLQGGGVVAGSVAPHSGPGVLAGSVKQVSGGLGRKGLIGIVAGVVAVAVVAVGVIAATRDSPTTAEPATGGGTTQPATVPSTSASSPSPNELAGFQGEYRYDRTITSSNSKSFPVGQKNSATFAVATTCAATCDSAMKWENGATATLDFGESGEFQETKPATITKCEKTIDGKVVESDTVPGTYTRTIKVAEVVDDRVEKLTGKETLRDSRRCKSSSLPPTKVDYRIVITRVG